MLLNKMQFYTFYVFLYYMSSQRSFKERKPETTEACLADGLELLELDRLPRITACPQIQINTRNRVQIYLTSKANIM